MVRQSRSHLGQRANQGLPPCDVDPAKEGGSDVFSVRNFGAVVSFSGLLEPVQGV